MEILNEGTSDSDMQYQRRKLTKKQQAEKNRAAVVHGYLIAEHGEPLNRKQRRRHEARARAALAKLPPLL